MKVWGWTEGYEELKEYESRYPEIGKKYIRQMIPAAPGLRAAFEPCPDEGIPDKYTMPEEGRRHPEGFLSKPVIAWGTIEEWDSASSGAFLRTYTYALVADYGSGILDPEATDTERFLGLFDENDPESEKRIREILIWRRKSRAEVQAEREAKAREDLRVLRPEEGKGVT